MRPLSAHPAVLCDVFQLVGKRVTRQADGLAEVKMKYVNAEINNIVYYPVSYITSPHHWYEKTLRQTALAIHQAFLELLKTKTFIE